MKMAKETNKKKKNAGRNLFFLIFTLIVQIIELKIEINTEIIRGAQSR
jgi:hypothetical protein